MEITVCNYYRHSVSGTVSPRLPVGWVASPAQASLRCLPDSGSGSCLPWQLPRASGVKSTRRRQDTIQRPGGQGNSPVANHVQLGGDTDADRDQRQRQRKLPPGDAGAGDREPGGFGSAIYGWTGDVSILANPAAATTTATVPSSNVSIRATYSGGTTGGVEKIRYHPRSGFGWRMVGGVFEASNGNKDSGPYTPLHTILTEPSGWTEVDANSGDFGICATDRPAADSATWRKSSSIVVTTSSVTELRHAGSYSGGSLDGYPAALDSNISTFFDSNQAATLTSASTRAPASTH